MTARLRQRCEAYSLAITLLQARMPPTPRPVSTRSAASCVALWLKAEPSMPTPERARQARISGRRPSRSAQGAISSDPPAMPNRPALSRKPSWAPLSCQCADTAEAVNAMTRTSKPSIMLSTMHRAMTDHWKRVIGRWSTLARRSALMAAAPATGNWTMRRRKAAAAMGQG